MHVTKGGGFAHTSRGNLQITSQAGFHDVGGSPQYHLVVPATSTQRAEAKNTETSATGRLFASRRHACCISSPLSVAMPHQVQLSRTCKEVLSGDLPFASGRVLPTSRPVLPPRPQQVNQAQSVEGGSVAADSALTLSPREYLPERTGNAAAPKSLTLQSDTDVLLKARFSQTPGEQQSPMLRFRSGSPGAKASSPLPSPVARMLSPVTMSVHRSTATPSSDVISAAGSANRSCAGVNVKSHPFGQHGTLARPEVHVRGNTSARGRSQSPTPNFPLAAKCARPENAACFANYTSLQRATSPVRISSAPCCKQAHVCSKKLVHYKGIPEERLDSTRRLSSPRAARPALPETILVSKSMTDASSVSVPHSTPRRAVHISTACAPCALSQTAPRKQRSLTDLTVQGPWMTWHQIPMSQLPVSPASQTQSCHNNSMPSLPCAESCKKELSVPPFFYDADVDDPIDTAMLHELVALNLDVSVRLNVQRLGPGKYEIEGRQVHLSFEGDKLLVDDDQEKGTQTSRQRGAQTQKRFSGSTNSDSDGELAAMPLAEYLRQVANVTSSPAQHHGTVCSGQLPAQPSTTTRCHPDALPNPHLPKHGLTESCVPQRSLFPATFNPTVHESAAWGVGSFLSPAFRV